MTRVKALGVRFDCVDLGCTQSLTNKGDHASILASYVARPADIATNIIRIEWCYVQYFSRDTIDNFSPEEIMSNKKDKLMQTCRIQ